MKILNIFKKLKSRIFTKWTHYTLVSKKNDTGVYEHEIYVNGKLLQKEGSVNGWLRVNDREETTTKVIKVNIAKISVKAHKGD